MKQVGLLVSRRPPPHWDVLVHALIRWCEARHADPAEETVDAWLASGPDAPGVAAAARTGAPLAVLDDGDGAPEYPPSAVRIITVAPGDPRACFFPTEGLDAAERVPVTPFVRARWRRRYGLVSELVVRPDALPAELVGTGLALCSAVVASGRHVLEALAWAAPCVTDASSAAAIGAEHGVHVLVATGEEQEEEARALGADHRRAAELGRAGRRLVEAAHDTGRAAEALARRLGLLPSSASPLTAVDQRLDELWTRPDARIRARAAEAVAALAPAAAGNR